MIINLTRGTLLAGCSYTASSAADRLRGMIGRRFEPGKLEAMVFPRCGSIHCCWMKFPIDAVFIDRDRRITAIFHALKPWRIAFGGSGAHTVIEMPAGIAAGTGCMIGDLLDLDAPFAEEGLKNP